MRSVKDFLFSMSSRPTVGPNQPPIQWVPGTLSSIIAVLSLPRKKKGFLRSRYLAMAVM
jgi:hypothetical protein